MFHFLFTLVFNKNITSTLLTAPFCMIRFGFILIKTNTMQRPKIPNMIAIDEFRLEYGHFCVNNSFQFRITGTTKKYSKTLRVITFLANAWIMITNVCWNMYGMRNSMKTYWNNPSLSLPVWLSKYNEAFLVQNLVSFL